MLLKIDRLTCFVALFALCAAFVVWDHNKRLDYLEGQVAEWNAWFASSDLDYYADESITVRPDNDFQLIGDSLGAACPALQVLTPDTIKFPEENYNDSIGALAEAIHAMKLSPELLALATAEQATQTAGIRDELRTMVRTLVLLAHEEDKDRDELRRILTRIERKLE